MPFAVCMVAFGTRQELYGQVPAVILSKRTTSTSKIRVASRKDLTMHIDAEIPDAPPSPPGGPDVPKSPPAPPTPTDEPPPKPVDDPPPEAEPKPPYTVGVM